MDFRLGSARNLLFQTILKYVQKHIVTDIYVGEMEFSSFILNKEVHLKKRFSWIVKKDPHNFAYNKVLSNLAHFNICSDTHSKSTL